MMSLEKTQGSVLLAPNVMDLRQWDSQKAAATHSRKETNLETLSTFEHSQPYRAAKQLGYVS